MQRVARPVVGLHPVVAAPSAGIPLALLPPYHPKRLLLRAAEAYTSSYFALLRRWGLRVDDCLSEENFPVVQRSVRLLAPHVREARVRRAVRAVDLHSKHAVLPEWMQQHQRPDVPYLWPIVNDLERRRLEQLTYR